jgi:hypothetical protein
VAAFHSLGTTVRSSDHHSEVNVPGLLLRSLAVPFSGPCGLLLHRLPRFRSRDRRLQRSDPLPENCPALPVSPRISTSRWDFLPLRIRAFNPIRSRASSLSEFARFPFAPRNRLSLNCQFRINVPGPLRFRKPAVPQTSWNLLDNAPDCRFGQINSALYLRISSHPIEVYLHADSGPDRCICCG